MPNFATSTKEYYTVLGGGGSYNYSIKYKTFMALRALKSKKLGITSIRIVKINKKR